MSELDPKTGTAGGARVTFAGATARRRVVIFCGKGGAGKTTLAAASALGGGSRSARTLLLGTDPAATLPRVLGVDLTADAEIAPGVIARQIVADVLLERFREQHGAIIAGIIEGGTYLDRADAEALCARSLPGIDEILALLELADALSKEDGQDVRAIVDTAPSQHALRLVTLPETFDAMLSLLDTMRQKARAVEAALTHRNRDDAADRLLRSLGDSLARLRKLLRDQGAAGFVAVARADAASVAEADRLARDLMDAGLAPIAVVLNAVEDEVACCERGERRRESAARARRELAHRFPGVPVFEMPRVSPEPIGIGGLRALGARLLAAVDVRGEEHLSRRERSRSAERSTGEGESSPSSPHLTSLPSTALGATLTLIGGKGGVGKTTIAAALAIALTDAAGTRRCLVASIGGPGLSRTLAEPLGDEPRTLASVPGLDAVEIDARARFERLRAGYREDVERALDRLIGGGNMDLTYDREVIRGLLDLAPPGIDEIVALSFLLDASGQYERIVLDCAPTGHFVRFLEMPKLAREWLTLALRLLAKYSELSDTGALERTVALLRRVRAVSEMLCDPARTALVLVSLPERIPADETARLRDRAQGAGVAPALVIVNRLEPETRCPTCSSRRAAGMRAADLVARALSPTPALSLAEADDEPRGLAGLRALRFAALPAGAAA